MPGDEGFCVCDEGGIGLGLQAGEYGAQWVGGLVFGDRGSRGVGHVDGEVIGWGGGRGGGGGECDGERGEVGRGVEAGLAQPGAESVGGPQDRAEGRGGGEEGLLVPDGEEAVGVGGGGEEGVQRVGEGGRRGTGEGGVLEEVWRRRRRKGGRRVGGAGRASGRAEEGGCEAVELAAGQRGGEGEEEAGGARRHVSVWVGGGGRGGG